MPFIKSKESKTGPLEQRRINHAPQATGTSRKRLGGWAGAKNNVQDKGRSPYPPLNNAAAPIEIPNQVDTGRLEPVAELWGETILISPYESVHPMDCGLWPQSIFCSPADAFDFGKFVGVNVDFYDNGSETVITIAPTIAWLSLPPMIIASRYAIPFKTPKKQLPQQANSTFYPLPSEFETTAGCIYLVLWDLIQPDGTTQINGGNATTFGPILGVTKTVNQEINIGPGLAAQGYDQSIDFYYVDYDIYALGHGAAPSIFPNTWTGPNYSPVIGDLYGGSSPNRTVEGSPATETPSRIRAYLVTPETAPIEEWGLSFQRLYDWNEEHCGKLYGDLLPPPNSPPNGEDPPMCDCKKMEADLKAIKKFLGVKKEPWNVPADLGQKSGGQTTVPDIAEMMIYFMKQMSGMLGATGEMKIKVKDANITQEGNQEVELEFPNLAEAITNLAGLALTNQSIAVATLQASMRGIVQSGQAFTSAAVAAEQTEVIMEWLGFKLQKESFEVPLVYTPGETSPDKFLKESTAKVTYWDVDDKTGLQTYLNAFIEAANLIKASLFQGVVDGTDLSYRTKKAAKELKVTSEDLDSFIESVEQGFPDLPGSDVANPYGRPYDERPKIRKLGGNQDESEP